MAATFLDKKVVRGNYFLSRWEQPPPPVLANSSLYEFEEAGGEFQACFYLNFPAADSEILLAKTDKNKIITGNRNDVDCQIDKTIGDIILGFCSQKNWVNDWETNGPVHNLKNTQAAVSASMVERSIMALPLLQRFARLYKPLFLRNFYMLVDLCEGKIRTFDFQEFKSRGLIQFWTDLILILNTVGLQNLLNHCHSRFYRIVDSMIFVLEKHCTQARKQCRGLTFQILRLISKVFVLDGRENETREKEVIQKIQAHENCWEEIYWQHKTCAVIDCFRQICNTKNNTLQAANTKQILSNLDSVNHQYNPEAAAGGTKNEVQKNLTILRNLIVNKKSSVLSIREIIIDGQTVAGVDTIDDSIHDFLEFCQSDPHAFMQSPESVGEMIKEFVTKPVSSLNLQRMFLGLALNFIKQDFKSTEYAGELLQLTLKLVENRVLEDSITNLYHEFLPVFIIYGSADEQELIDYIERLLKIQSFSNKSNCNNLFKRLTILPMESFQFIK